MGGHLDLFFFFFCNYMAFFCTSTFFRNAFVKGENLRAMFALFRCGYQVSLIYACCSWEAFS